VRRHRLLFVALALVALRVVVLAVEIHVVHGDHAAGLFRYDAGQYHRVASAAGRAWRDVPVPFPPLGYLTMKLVNAATLDGTITRLVWMQLGSELLVAAALWYGWGKRAATVYLVVGTVFLAQPFTYFRMDLTSVAFATWGLALLRRRRDLPAGVALACGIFTKVWPAALVPATLASRRVRAFTTTVVASATILAAWIAYGGTGGPGQVLTMRGVRGWELESLPGSVWQIVGGTASARFEQGAWRIGSMPPWTRGPLFLAMVGTVVVVWVLASRLDEHASGLRDGVAPLAAVTAFLVLGPIISPQYLVWLLPFAALAWVGGERRVAGLAAGAAALTALMSFDLPGLLTGAAAVPVVLLARNLVLVVLLVASVDRLHAAHAAPEAPAPEPVPVLSGVR
jgi:hypothetical protein